MGGKQSSWRIETSIFSNYRPNTDALVQQCFEFDFESSKIPRLVKDELESVKEVLSQYYPLLFHSYKFYAA